MAKFRWGILSTAAIAKRAFVPGVRNGTEGIIAAVGSRSLATAQAFAADLDIPVAHASYEALLADPEIDGVYIGLPNSMHLEWTIKAAEAGKHVLCEKPLARTVADARKMVDACAEAGVVLMEAFMYRHHPQHAVARHLIEGIGDVAYVRASFNYTMGGPRLENRDHRIRPDMEGGGLMDVGCYAVNAARFIYGTEPVEVTAMQRVSDAFEVDMSFAGCFGSRAVGWQSSTAALSQPARSSTKLPGPPGPSGWRRPTSLAPARRPSGSRGAVWTRITRVLPSINMRARLTTSCTPSARVTWTSRLRTDLPRPP